MSIDFNMPFDWVAGIHREIFKYAQMCSLVLLRQEFLSSLSYTPSPLGQVLLA